MPPFRSHEELEREAQTLLTRHSQTMPPVDPVVIARVEVFEATFNDPRVSGLLRTENGQRVIYVSAADPLVRRRYSIAHECGHAILHSEDGDFADGEKELTVLFRRAEDLLEQDEADQDAKRARKRREIQANIFAACLLIPRDMLAEVLEYTDDISDLTRIFGVSRQTLGIRLSDLGIEW